MHLKLIKLRRGDGQETKTGAEERSPEETGVVYRCLNVALPLVKNIKLSEGSEFSLCAHKD